MRNFFPKNKSHSKGALLSMEANRKSQILLRRHMEVFPFTFIFLHSFFIVHSERPKLHRVLAILSAVGLISWYYRQRVTNTMEETHGSLPIHFFNLFTQLFLTLLTQNLAILSAIGLISWYYVELYLYSTCRRHAQQTGNQKNNHSAYQHLHNILYTMR